MTVFAEERELAIKRSRSGGDPAALLAGEIELWWQDEALGREITRRWAPRGSSSARSGPTGKVAYIFGAIVQPQAWVALVLDTQAIAMALDEISSQVSTSAAADQAEL